MRALRRLSIRARLTVAFAAATLIVLALVAAFVYTRVESELTEATDEALSSRLAGLRALVANAPDDRPPELVARPSDDPEDNFSQVLGGDGELIASTLPPSSGAAIDPAAAARAQTEELLVPQVDLAGVDGSARVLAGPVTTSGGRATERLVVLTGTANQDRSETLSRVAGAFVVGAPLALLLAAAAGYGLARRALRPVEEMRARAEGIGNGSQGERLPLPEANDEVRALGITLNSMLARLEEALEREKDFVADASHELRTPLAILRVELELALHSDRTPGELRTAVGSALHEVDRLARLADDLLVAARVDRGEIPIRRERVDVTGLLARVCDRFDAAAKQAGRTVERIVTEGLSASIDPLRAEQALGNLIDNALVHGEGAIAVAARNDDGELLVEVSDQGSGFPASFRDQAFERFSRADAGRTGGGAGLGLAIVAAIASAHEGRVALLATEHGAVQIAFGPASVE